MSRRSRRGRDISGWLPVDKPAGRTSFELVQEAKTALSAQKAGHAGTLDRPATGVLAIAFGDATKTISFITDLPKTYLFTVTFGQATETDDAQGEVIATSEKRPTDEEILDAMEAFRGDILQVPPQYSAVKVDGTRAYKRALDGDRMDLEPRPLAVHSFRLIERASADHCTFEFICGKGGYVRSIARDIGEALGCYGHVQQLRRTQSGPFDEENCVSLETLRAVGGTDESQELVWPLETGLKSLPELTCNMEGAALLRMGNEAPVAGEAPEFGETAWASCGGRAVAVGTYEAGYLKPSKVFKPAKRASSKRAGSEFMPQ